MSITPTDVLQAVYRLFDNRDKFTMGAFARVVDGYPIGPCEKRAHSFCAIGACRAVAGGNELVFYDAVDALEHQTITLFGLSVMGANDCAGGYENIRRALRTALKEAGVEVT